MMRMAAVAMALCCLSLIACDKDNDDKKIIAEEDDTVEGSGSKDDVTVFVSGKENGYAYAYVAYRLIS